MAKYKVLQARRVTLTTIKTTPTCPDFTFDHAIRLPT